MNKPKNKSVQAINPNGLSNDSRSGYFFSESFINLAKAFKLDYGIFTSNYYGLTLNFGKNNAPVDQVIIKTFYTKNEQIEFKIEVGFPEYASKTITLFCETVGIFFETFIENLVESSTQSISDSLSPFLVEKIDIIKKMSSSAASILISGETGTGKDFLANFIHLLGRSDFPLVTINLASIPNELFEIELFGYEKGSFTDATHAKAGKFQLSQKGTLVLDHIDLLPLHQQAKLLHVLQDGFYYPIGAQSPIKLEARIICLSNQSLEDLVLEEKFRKDLYYRINVLPFRLPALRERRADINFFINFFCEKHQLSPETVSNFKIIKAWELYDWPGNIRELENELQKLLLFPDTKLSVEAPAKPQKPSQKTLKESINLCKKRAIYDTLKEFKGNQSLAAKALGIQRTYLSRLIKEFSEDN